MINPPGGPSLVANAVAPWPFFDREEIDAAVRVLQSGKVNYWTGDEGRTFEREFADFLGCKHAVAVANGTLALELALRILDVGAGDEVITSPRTFIATASSVVSVGARPVFVDVDPVTQNIGANAIEQAITSRTAAILVVHLAGWPCDMDPILEMARHRGIFVIEDCAQAHGATYKGHSVGSLGDVGAFSFCQDKIMTTAGEGGIVTMNSTELFARAWAYRDHGKKYDAATQRSRSWDFEWPHESWGSNLRLTEVQAAVGRVQLRRLNNWIDLRRKHARVLNDALAGLDGIRLTRPPEWIGHSYYKFYAFVQPQKLRAGWGRDRIVAEMNARGIPCFTGGRGEVYREKVLPQEWWPAERLSVARELSETSLMCLVHPTLTEEQMNSAAECLRHVVMLASR